MLAASARRASFVPFVVDAFGDTDTRQLAAGIEVIPTAMARGFKEATLLPALERLTALSAQPPLGLVLGTGFEECPELVAKLSQHWRILGCGAETIAQAKSPSSFFSILAELGIPHPETRLSPPPDGRGWLTRRTGGTGGTHIAVCRSRVAAHSDRYFQRRLEGVPIALSGVVSRHRYGLAFTRQWVDPGPRRPYRFGGTTGPVALDPDAEARMIDVAVTLTPRLGLLGLVSFDFLIVDGEPLLLEVNPRPGASLDVLDDSRGGLFAAHVEVCMDPAATGALPIAAPPDIARAAAYLYCGPHEFQVSQIDWPEWTADRPCAGTAVPPHTPIATVFGEGDDAAAAIENCRSRSDRLQQMLYKPKSG